MPLESSSSQNRRATLHSYAASASDDVCDMIHRAHVPRMFISDERVNLHSDSCGRIA